MHKYEIKISYLSKRTLAAYHVHASIAFVPHITWHSFATYTAGRHLAFHAA